MAPYINGDDTYVSEDFLVNLLDDHVVSKVHCRWRIADQPAKAEAARYFHSIDLLLRVQPHTTDEGEGPPLESATGTALETLVRSACPDQSEVTTKVILAPVDGYLCRADVLELRMRHSECVDTVVSFASWNRRLPGFSRHDRRTLLPLLLSSPGAIVVKRTAEPRFDLREDLEMRLSFDWILPQKPAAYKVALVAGRHRYKSGRYRAQGFLDAARALGIAITILDREGHWLQEQTYAHLRDDFIAVDLSHDAWLPQRIFNAVRGREFDGLVTFTDEYVLATGEVAEMLGLPTEPFRAIQLALHKEQMRKVVDNANIQAFFLQRAGQLHDPVSASSLANLRYPLVVKPAYGRSSEGVRKVTDEIGMREAVGMLTADGLADQGILLETYVDGPELDCNFVLCDGEVLFLELTDDLPSTADASGATLADNFSETVMISHSGLPAAEQEALRDSLQCSLRDLGLRWGIFHAEARMQHSSVRYDADQNLVPTTPAPSCEPTPFLIEVNVRPPGIGSSFTPLYTYGIDYNALHLLRAVGDRARFVALSQGFRFPASAGGGGGAQYWAANCMIPMHRNEIFVPVDFMDRLYARVPEIVPFVSKAELHVEAGRVAFVSGGVGFIAYVLLFSRAGREHVLAMYREVVKAGLEILDEGL